MIYLVLKLLSWNDATIMPCRDLAHAFQGKDASQAHCAMLRLHENRKTREIIVRKMSDRKVENTVILHLQV